MTLNLSMAATATGYGPMIGSSSLLRVGKESISGTDKSVSSMGVASSVTIVGERLETAVRAVGGAKLLHEEELSVVLPSLLLLPDPQGMIRVAAR